jgi:FAD/FMN-containing dehydrogenase
MKRSRRARQRLGERIVNDVHSRLNPTVVADVVSVESLESLQSSIRRARERGDAVAISGGRHAMGGQQFCADGVLLDMSRLDQVLGFDPEAGTIEVEAGIQWPAVLRWLHQQQLASAARWGIAQKQTGANNLSIGGALAANVHGRGLQMPPFVADLARLVAVDPSGDVRECSRDEDGDLFRLIVGGYGLFGAVYAATLRLVPHRKLERVVEIILVDDLIRAFEDRIANGFLYGDLQFAIDPRSDDFLRRGVFSCYRPVPAETPIPREQRVLTAEDWNRLLFLAHTDKTRAFELYAAHYLATSGQIYLSDEHQLALYVDGYHGDLDASLGLRGDASEMITEVYVPRDRLADYMAAVADDFRDDGTDVVYGTIRLVERDEETFLVWAREPWACVIFNLHVEHSEEGIERSARAFRRLIDRAIERGGSYYLTYHRHATLEQLEACYPQFGEFLLQKRELDPDEVFQSDWYRHYQALFAHQRPSGV